MTARTDYVIRRGLRSPRSAAIAGIIYSILMTTGMVLTDNITRDVPQDITKEWLEAWSNTASVAITLVPFAGIAVSVYILILNYRRTHEQTGSDGLSVAD
ncbi:MAG: hypothetical protein GWN58_05270 [Anaerolineae bacterium]|nr:hypothetical protein [Anaerolineae bacterium]